MPQYTSAQILHMQIFNEKCLRYFSNAFFYRNPDDVPGICKPIVEQDLNKLKEMVDAGADFKAFDEFGNGPYHIAVAKMNSEIIDYLLSKSKRYIDKQNFLKETPLVKALKEKRYDIAEKLIRGGADITIPDRLTSTPQTLSLRNPKIAHLLIELEVDINRKDRNDMTPLHIAVELNCLETVCMLLFYGADVTIRDCEGFTPFMRAIECEFADIQQEFLNYMDNLDSTTDCNYATLDLALRYNSPFADKILNTVELDTTDNEIIDFAINYTNPMDNENVEVFRRIWEAVDYQPGRTRSLLWHASSLDTKKYFSVLNVLMNSNKFSIVTDSVILADDFLFVLSRSITVYKITLDKISELFCLLLTYGYVPTEDDLKMIYDRWGYCELFNILLHVEDRPSSMHPHYLGEQFIKLFKNVDMSTHQLIRQYIPLILMEDYQYNDNVLNIFRVLDFSVCPQLMNFYLELNRSDIVAVKMDALPKVPSLLELARNQTRQHLIKTYQVTKSSILHSLIDNLNINEVYKKILRFEKAIYKPVYTEIQFETLIIFLKDCLRRRPEYKRNWLIQSLENSYVTYL